MFEKITQQSLLMFCILKKKKYVLLIFQTQPLIKKSCLNDPKQRKRRLSLSCSLNISCIMPWNNLNCLHSFGTKKNLSLMKKYVKTKIFVEL